MAKLQEKHKKALLYLKQNRFTIEQVAEKVGLTAGRLYELMRGEPRTGELGQLFAAEWGKVNQHVEQRTNQRILNIRESLYRLLQRCIESFPSDVAELTGNKRYKQIIDAVNALNKAYPQINIEQYVWKVGMSKEEAINEFRRLTALAGKAAIRRSVQDIKQGRSEQIFDHPEQTDKSSEDSQDPILPAEPPAEEVPPSDESDPGDLRGK